MPLETGSFIDDLTASNPPGSDPAGQGDDHIRLIKTCLKGSMPNMGGIFGQVRVQDVAGSISSTYNTSHFICTNSATATVVLTLPVGASVTAGFFVDITTLTLAQVSVLPGVGGNIAGSGSYSVPEQSTARLFYQGANVWRGITTPNNSALFPVTGNLYVAGTSTLSGAVTMNTTLSVSGNATMQGILHVDGATTLSGACTMNSTLSVSGGFHAKTTASIGGTLAVLGATQLASTLSVSGAFHANTTASIGGAAILNGAVTMNSTLSVSGGFHAKGVASIGSTLAVLGAVTLASTLSVSGAFHANTTASIGGTLTLAAALNLASGQIGFPAAQNASAGVNTFDDYEEGLWTPTLTSVTPGDLSTVYVSRGGTYTKVGRLVSFSFIVTTSSWAYTTASGNIRVTGLPFAIATAWRASCPVGSHSVNVGTDLTVGAFVQSSEVRLQVSDTSTGSTSALDISGFPSGVQVELTVAGVYEAAT